MASPEGLPQIKIALDRPIGSTGAHIDSKLAQITSLGIQLGIEHDRVGEWLDDALEDGTWENVSGELGKLYDGADTLLSGLMRHIPRDSTITTDQLQQHEQQQIAWRESLAEINSASSFQPGLKDIRFGTQGLAEQFAGIRAVLSSGGFDELARNADTFRRAQIERSLAYKRQLIAFQNAIKARQKMAVSEALNATERALEREGTYPDMATILSQHSTEHAGELIARARDYCRKKGFYELEHHIVVGAREYYQKLNDSPLELRQQRMESLSFSALQIRLIQMEKWIGNMPLHIARESYRDAKQLAATVGNAQKSRAEMLLQRIAQRIFMEGASRAGRSIKEAEAEVVLYTHATERMHATTQEIEKERARIAFRGLRWAQMAIDVEHEMKWGKKADKWGDIFKEAWRDVREAEEKLWRYTSGSPAVAQAK